jgi:integron integrase
MGNSTKGQNEQPILPEFQQFLAQRQLVPANRVSFFAYWINRYLRYADKNALNASDYDELAIMHFLEYLRSDSRILDWQHRQAEDALQLYYFHYLGKTKQAACTPGEMNCIDLTAEIVRILRLKHYSNSTERTYVQWVERFGDYMQQSGKKLVNADAVDFKNYLSHLALNQKVSSSTQNQAFNAILFLFRHILHRPVENLDNTVRAKRGKRLPVVLTVDEVRKLFDQMESKERLMAELLYGAGLRLMELARLRVQDIDFGSKTIFIRSGKGDKDRTTILPEAVKDRLQEQLKAVKVLHEKDISDGHGAVYLPDAIDRKYPKAAREWIWQYAFPAANLSVDPRSGVVRRHHISDSAIQGAMKMAVKKAGIVKHATVHTLRHSFATHLIMNGVNIREVQELLGHKSVETTMIYTHVLKGMSSAPLSPLDSLMQSQPSL